VPAVTDLVARTAGELDGDTVAALQALLAGLPDRFAAVAACGVPDTLVHGDFHPGNTRGSVEGRSVLLDWGDCGIGNPLLDQAAFLSSLGEPKREPVRAAWASLWRDAVPVSATDRAAVLLAPVGALRQALIYRTFLDGIEPTERVYHANDPATWLRRAAGLS
jgi:Ser/Thr protein kinase RdoA (MazF antagonist)